MADHHNASVRLSNQKPPCLLAAPASAVQKIPGGFFPLPLWICGKVNRFQVRKMQLTFLKELQIRNVGASLLFCQQLQKFHYSPP